MQVITDFEQGLRNAITRVLPEANNTGCWFHYIQVLFFINKKINEKHVYNM